MTECPIPHLGERLTHVGIAALVELLGAHDNSRLEAVELRTSDARSGDDDFLHRFRLRRILRCLLRVGGARAQSRDDDRLSRPNPRIP